MAKVPVAKALMYIIKMSMKITHIAPVKAAPADEYLNGIFVLGIVEYVSRKRIQRNNFV